MRSHHEACWWSSRLSATGLSSVSTGPGARRDLARSLDVQGRRPLRALVAVDDHLVLAAVQEQVEATVRAAGFAVGAERPGDAVDELEPRALRAGDAHARSDRTGRP